MPILYTIGFTKKKAKEFFETLIAYKVDTVIDIRLNNTSQLAGFSKYPDIDFFLDKLCNIKYIHDTNFAPTNETLESYKKNIINWEEYVSRFTKTMDERKIHDYIKGKYDSTSNKTVCLLCSEIKADKCHRKLVAQYFSEIFNGIKIINI